MVPAIPPSKTYGNTVPNIRPYPSSKTYAATIQCLPPPFEDLCPSSIPLPMPHQSHNAANRCVHLSVARRRVPLPLPLPKCTRPRCSETSVRPSEERRGGEWPPFPFHDFCPSPVPLPEPPHVRQPLQCPCLVAAPTIATRQLQIIDDNDDQQRTTARATDSKNGRQQQTRTDDQTMPRLRGHNYQQHPRTTTVDDNDRQQWR